MHAVVIAIISQDRGSYFVRDSETTLGDYLISVQDRERVQDYRIKWLIQNGTLFFFITRRVTFESIVDLVVFYQSVLAAPAPLFP